MRCLCSRVLSHSASFCTLRSHAALEKDAEAALVQMDLDKLRAVHKAMGEKGMTKNPAYKDVHKVLSEKPNGQARKYKKLGQESESG